MWTLKVDWITAPVLVIQVGRINENTPVIGTCNIKLGKWFKIRISNQVANNQDEVREDSN